jgi:hypothetical protein
VVGCSIEKEINVIEIRATGVVASEPRVQVGGNHPAKTCVRINVVDAQGRVQWLDCRSTNPRLRRLLAKLRVGDPVQLKGEPAWCFYTKSDGVMQGLQTRVSVSVIRRLGSPSQSRQSKEAA